MAGRRILLWFPRLAADRATRRRKDAVPVPVAVVGDRNGARVLVPCRWRPKRQAWRAGPALARCDRDLPRASDRAGRPLAEAQFLLMLRRWAGRFSPWVADEAPAGLMIDLTGSAHLHGGEDGVLDRVAEDCERLGPMAVRAAIADTPGAAWGLARYASAGVVPVRWAMPSTRRRGRRGPAPPSAGGGSGAAACRGPWPRGGPRRRWLPRRVGFTRRAGPLAAGRPAAGRGCGGPAAAAGPAPGGRHHGHPRAALARRPEGGAAPSGPGRWGWK